MLQWHIIVQIIVSKEQLKSKVIIIIILVYLLGAAKCALTWMKESERREFLHIVKKIPLEKRKENVEKICSMCAKIYSCDCSLQNHFLESHKRHPARSLSTVCPFCTTGCKNKCVLLKHVYMKHSSYKEAAKVALKERGHCDEKYSFITEQLNCEICSC